MSETTTRAYDFGTGPTPAHRHANGGGLAMTTDLQSRGEGERKVPVCGTVYEVIIAKDQRSGFPAGLWVRLCYLPMARSVVERLASEGVKASIQACVGVQ